MAINRKISRKKLITYSILMALVIIGNVVIYLRNSQSSQSIDMLLELAAEPEGGTLISDKKIIKQNKQIKSIVESNLFITLQKIGDWPVQPKNIGKTDPFAPFFKQP